MAKIYFRDTKGRPKKAKPWTMGRKYKWAFWALLWGNVGWATNEWSQEGLEVLRLWLGALLG